MSDLSAITGEPVTNLDDLTDFIAGGSYMNVDYLQNILLPYAQENWKIFVLPLTLLFFLISLFWIVIIWFYILILGPCCRCFCRCFCSKKKKDEEEVLLRSPVSSPRSSPVNVAHVTSSSPRGGSPKAMTASAQINKLHQQQISRDKNAGKVVPPKRRCLCCVTICPSLIFLVMAAIIAFIFVKSDEIDTSVLNFVDDTNSFTIATSDLLCSDELGERQCVSNSLGQFVKNSKNIFHDVSDETITFIDTFTDDLETNIDNTILTLNDVLAEMETIEPNLVYISENMTALTNLYNDIPNTDPMDAPTISTDMMSEYTSVVNVSLTTINSINSDFSTMMDESLGMVKDMFTPGANDSVIDMVNDVLGQGLKYIYDANNYTVFAEQIMSTILADETVEDITEVEVGNIGPIDLPIDPELSIPKIPQAWESTTVGEMTIESLLQSKTYILCILFVIPAIMLLLTTLLNFCCFKRGCRIQLCCSMCINCFFIPIVFLFTFLWAFFGVFMQITCQYPDDVIALLPETNYTLDVGSGDPIELMIGPTLINDILTCSDENKNEPFKYSETDNLVSILGLSDDLTLVNNTIQVYKSNITGMLDALPTDMIDNAESQITGINVTSIFDSISEYIDLVDEISTNLTDIKNSLPTSTAINTESVRVTWNDTYFVHTYPAYWNLYKDGVNEINDVLASANALQTGLETNFTYESILTTPVNAFGEDSCYCDSTAVTCTATCTTAADYANAGTDYATLNGTLYALNKLAGVFNMTNEINTELFANLTTMETYTSNIENTLIKINDTLDVIGDYIVDLGGDVNGFIDTINSIAPGIDGVVTKIMQLPTLIANLPAYMKCYFIADFYQNAFQEVVCKEFTPSLLLGSWSMLLFMIVLMFSFIVSSCCCGARHISEDLVDDNESDESSDDEYVDDSESGIQMTYSRQLSLKSNQARPVSVAM